MRWFHWAVIVILGGPAVATTGAAADCLADVQAFDQRVADAGYWMGGAAVGTAGGNDTPDRNGFRSLKPSHELRVLVASAIILARQKQERRCQDTLASANEVFRLDSQDRVNSVPAVVREEGWRQQQIDSAVVVSNNYPFYRADELIGTEVRDPRDALLGNVADVIQVRQSGKIAYLIIDRGSVFGFAGKPVAVPWADFRITPTASLLVLDTSQVALDQAPSGYDRYPKTTAAADLQAKQIDAYWSAH